jgi:DNA modification methylase
VTLYVTIFMNSTTTPAALHHRVLETKLLKWKDFQFIQPDHFKELSPDAGDKLKQSILSNQFTQPFYVWYDAAADIYYCLDGYHRVKALHELDRETFLIPESLPATLIACDSKEEAAKLVLIYSSIYANITQQGLFDFLKLYDLQYESIRNQIDIPDFSTERFEQKFDLFDVCGAEEPEVTSDSAIIVQAGDLFQLNGHRVMCGSFTDILTVVRLMDGKKARILNTDPPYNLPADFFLKNNRRTHNHTDFAMGSGEMSDEEFVSFLALIMQTAVEHSVPGAIHYIFMDWRHVWHMAEASRKVYGSPIPKQLCVWNKDMMANGSFYRAKHELCFVFGSPQAKSLWNRDLADHGGGYKENNELVFIFKAGGDEVKHLSHLELKDRIRSNVWNYPSATSTANPDRFELKNHPTPKPVQMICDAILDTTHPGDIVLDWFLGSGTCLMACEQTQRLCYATEIEPKYVQSIIKRYLNHCEKKGIEVKFSHLNGSLTLNHFRDVHQPVH